MGGKKRFLGAEFTSRFTKSYRSLSRDRQERTDEVILALLKQEPTPGMRVKPIQPEKYYHEARISSGDRLVFRAGEGRILFVDVVGHDDIDRWGREVAERL